MDTHPGPVSFPQDRSPRSNRTGRIRRTATSECSESMAVRRFRGRTMALDHVPITIVSRFHVLPG